MNDTIIQTGIDALAAMFARVAAEDRPAFLPYFPIGYPTYDDSLAAIQAMAEENVDGFEIGIPFSDPLADGPVIQAATQKALENGTTVRHCLAAVKTLRERGVHQPMLLMGYLNPIIAYGIDNFLRDARSAGAQGLIVPDLPAEEADLLSDACAREGLALVLFLAPTSSDARIRMAAEKATGFIYVVSLTGVTGARSQLAPDIEDFLARVNAHVGNVPIVLGFGISTPEHVRSLKGRVNGYIVGSALVRAGKESVEAVRALTHSLRNAI